MGEEPVVRGGEARGDVQLVRVVGKPVYPGRPGDGSQLQDVGGLEFGPLEHEHQRRRPTREEGPQPLGERAAQQRVETAEPLLAATDFAAELLERGGEGEPAPVVARVERRHEHHAQPREGSRRHTST